MRRFRRFAPFDKAQGRLHVSHPSTRLRAGFTLLAAALCLGWMNPTRDRIAEANRLFKQGKFDDAIGTYGEALVDDPDSPLLNFNMGDANYKAGKYTEAINSFARAGAGDDDPKRVAKAAYNAGNAHYRLGAAAEATKPQDALQAYASALAAYRRALGADPAEQDAKFNYEFVSNKIDELKKKLEEQQQQQEQQQGDQPQEQQQQEQQQAQQEDGQEKQEQQAGDAEEQKDAERQEEQAAPAAGASGEEQKDEMSPQEAASLIDTAKNDELQPEEFARQVQGAAVAEPAQDW